MVACMLPIASLPCSLTLLIPPRILPLGLPFLPLDGSTPSLTHLIPLCILVQASPHATGHVPRQHGAMQLFIRNSADRMITLDVFPSASITSLLSKALSRFKEWSRQHRHVLFFRGTPLEPGRRLSEYSVFNHATLSLLSLLLGGMENFSTNQVKSISLQP